MVLAAATLRGSLSVCLRSIRHNRKFVVNFHLCLCGDAVRRLRFKSSTCNAAVCNASSIGLPFESDPQEFAYERDNVAVRPNYQTYLWLLETWTLNSSPGPITDVQKLHGLILKLGIYFEHELCGRLLQFYVSSGHMYNASKVLDDMLSNGLTMPASLWNEILCEFADKKSASKALKLFSRILNEDINPDEVTFANVLLACSGRVGKVGFRCIEQIHAMVIRRGFASNPIVCNPLIDLYSKSGFIESAGGVFEELSVRDNVSWVAMISGLSQNGHEEESILLFCNEMHSYGFVPTPYVMSSILSACSKIELFELGKELHALIFKWSLTSETFVCNALVTLYSRWGDLKSAEQIFRRLQLKDGVSYNSLITGLAQNGIRDRALQLFQKMQRNCVKPDCITLASLVSACAASGAFDQGRQLHSYAQKAGFCSDMMFEGSLLDLYVKCSDVETAHDYFLMTHTRNVVLWNVMLVMYGQMGDLNESYRIFNKMRMEGLEPNQYTYPSILRTCILVGDQELGEQLHTQVIKTGFHLNVYVCSVLIDMYAKLGGLETAEKIFRRLTEEDIVSWTAMMSGYTQHDMFFKALLLFKEMQYRGIQSDNIGLSSVITACAGTQALKQGQQIHAQSCVLGFSDDPSIRNALVSLYARCGKVKEAYLIFDNINDKDSISWNALISGLAQSGHYEEALRVFIHMNRSGVEANLFTYGPAISAAADTANINQGKQIHAKLFKTAYDSETQASNALISFYAKCGSIHDATRVFREIGEKNEITWNAMITGYSQHGYGKEAIKIFEEMKRHGQKPNNVTFVGVLAACSHVGLVEEGMNYFDSMSKDHGLVPKIEHYVCVVDILGRAGLLERAKIFIEKMPIEPDAMVWRTLLRACTVHKNVEIGEFASRHLLKVEPLDSATYVLMSNMYAVNRKWDFRDKARRMMKDKGVKKEPGRSWIEVGTSVHAFFAGDQVHPLADQIYEFLEDLNERAAEIGYVQDQNSLLTETEQSNSSVDVHSERLAIAFGLLSLSSTIPIRVKKNLRVCSDCHNWIKYVSKISNRTIVVRDAYRFHHFDGGSCSCKEYW